MSKSSPYDLVKVATALNQPEAELLQARLLDEGVPSLVRRTSGFDVPDLLAAGPRDVLVPASAAAVARELLALADLSAESTGADAITGAAGTLDEERSDVAYGDAAEEELRD